MTAVIVAPLIIVAQQKPADNPSVDVLLEQLRSAKVSQRIDGYERLKGNKAVLERADVRRALLDLLDRENKLVESTLRESDGREGVSGKYGEEFSEYEAELVESVVAFLDWNDQRQVCIVVRAAGGWQSGLADIVASNGKAAMPCLIQKSKSDLGIIRASAASIIAEILATTKDLPAATRNAARRVMLQALRDPSLHARYEIVSALKDYGDVDMLPAIKRLAEAEPQASLRKLAREAIADIQARAALKK
jgi:hypothetical protein